MPDIKRYGVYVAALVVAVAVLFATRFYYQGEIAQLKLDYAKHEKDISDAKIKALADAEQKQKKLQLDLAASAYQFHEELTLATTQNNDLRADLVSANKRLSIHVQARSCTTGTDHSSAGVMDLGETAILAADSQQTYSDLRLNITATEIKLAACQSYIEGVQKQYGIKQKPQ